MAVVYYKFKSAKDYESVAFDGHFISVGDLKAIILEAKQLGRGTDYDLLVTNAHTNEDYPDENMLIPRYTSVLVRRIPGLLRDRHPIVIAGGIPKSMLMATPDALPSGDVAVLKPNEGALEKEMSGMPSSSRSIGEVPPELKCPLCKLVMKDGVITSKCCFSSFCDKCIRDYTISKSVCVCGARGVLADDLLPNKTLRDTINRILECNNSSSENGVSAFQVQGMESRNLQAKAASPAQSAGQQVPKQEETPKMVDETKSAMELDKGRSLMKVDDDDVLKEAASQRSAPLGDEQKPCCGEAGKKKKIRLVPGGAAEMQWRAENYMMQAMGPCSFNLPYWNPYGGPMPPYMGYGVNPMDVGFGCILANGVPPQRELAEFNTGREDFGAHKAGLKRKEREYGGEHVSSTCKSNKSIGGSDRSLPRPSSKKKSEYEQDKHHHHHEEKDHRCSSNQRRSEPLTQPSSDKKHKASSVFSGICFPEDERHFKRRASEYRGLMRDRERPSHSKRRCTIDSSMHRPTLGAFLPCSF